MTIKKHVYDLKKQGLTEAKIAKTVKADGDLIHRYCLTHQYDELWESPTKPIKEDPKKFNKFKRLYEAEQLRNREINQ